MSKAALISTGYRISWGLSELLRHALTVRRKIAATRNHHIRLSHTGSPMALPHPQFSAGTVPDTAKATLAPLLKSGGGRWTLTADGEGLERTFKFAGFAKTWDFMTAVSLQCKLKKHHPEWSNVFNTTFIRWTTHNPKGLSNQDLDLACICDALARDFGEVVEEKGEASACELSSLANKVVSSAGNCCTPSQNKPQSTT